MVRESGDTLRLNEEFNPLEFEEKFDNALNAWKQEWVKPGSGPLRISERIRYHLPQDRLEAQEPEDKAYQELLDVCASALAKSVQTDEQEKVLAAIDTKIKLSFTGGQFTEKYELLRDITKEVLNKLAFKN
jgi:hypothetical protein